MPLDIYSNLLRNLWASQFRWKETHIFDGFSSRSSLLETLEARQLMSVGDISVGPPPSETATAVVVVLSPLETGTDRPQIAVTVNPPPVLTIPDKSPPPPPRDFVIVKFVDKSSPTLF